MPEEAPAEGQERKDNKQVIPNGAVSSSVFRSWVKMNYSVHLLRDVCA